ncbi:MAG: PCRF domain-containing protein, partial [Bdellovibrionales bacterium]
MNFGGFFEITEKEKRIKDLEEKSQSPKIWGNPKEMEKLNREKAALNSVVKEFSSLKTKADDALVLLEMAIEGEDEDDFLEA